MAGERRAAARVPAGREAFAAALRSQGLRVTAPRLAFYDVLVQAAEPLTPQEIGDRLAASGVNQATVYRLLEALTAAGALVPQLVRGSQVGYELSPPFRRHHHHLRCRGCGALTDIEGCDLSDALREIARRHAFRVEGHSLEVYGLCAACLEGPRR
ncbi:MAG: transcriptional repressor [Firmicutes bacterium]|nr:transcriptional repressor [Bacillota bacterium]